MPEDSSIRFFSEGLVDLGYLKIRERISQLLFPPRGAPEDPCWSMLVQCVFPSCARCQEIHELMLWFDENNDKGWEMKYGNPLICQTFVVVDANGEKKDHPDNIPEAEMPPPREPWPTWLPSRRPGAPRPPPPHLIMAR